MRLSKTRLERHRLRDQQPGIGPLQEFRLYPHATVPAETSCLRIIGDQVASTSTGRPMPAQPIEPIQERQPLAEGELRKHGRRIHE